jgi:adenylyltransferase/sulfurtransferase
MMPGPQDIGLLGVLPGVIGVIEATEVIKLILGIGRTLVGRLLIYDALEMDFQELHVERDPDCPVCIIEERWRNSI